MGNPLYGQIKADSKVGWKKTTKATKAHGTLAGNLVLDIDNMLNATSITCDPAAARTVTTPTAALTVAGIAAFSSDGKCEVGDTFQFSFINLGSAGDDETCTMTVGTGYTIIGFADVENSATTHDAFSVGSSLWAVRVDNATSGSEACSIVRLA